MPALLLPGTGSDSSQIITLVALFAAAVTIAEYATAYPGLVEFRYAPPFNRIRFASLFVTVLALSLIARGQVAPTALTDLAEALGTLFGHALDYAYSPVRLVTLALPETTSAQHVALVRSCAGLAQVISICTVTWFLAIAWLRRWPSGREPFNMWVNLPTFDPTAGGDILDRLRRDARFNLSLGIVLPFLLPAAMKLAAVFLRPMTLESPLMLIWMVAAWGFLPTSLLMRGIAMIRVARMIRYNRRRAAADQADGYQPA